MKSLFVNFATSEQSLGHLLPQKIKQKNSKSFSHLFSGEIDGLGLIECPFKLAFWFKSKQPLKIFPVNVFFAGLFNFVHDFIIFFRLFNIIFKISRNAPFRSVTIQKWEALINNIRLSVFFLIWYWWPFSTLIQFYFKLLLFFEGLFIAFQRFTLNYFLSKVSVLAFPFCWTAARSQSGRQKGRRESLKHWVFCFVLKLKREICRIIG